MRADDAGARFTVEAEPTVGVVIPAWNAGAWISEAVRSALAQRPRPIDVLVIDDGSTDETAAVVRSFEAPVRVVGQPNGGIGAARNRGAQLVEGDWVIFLDADDRLTADGLSCRIQALGRSPEATIAFGAVRRFQRTLDGEPIAVDRLRPAPLPGAMLVSRETLARVGPFATDTRVAEGLDWLLRARELGIVEVMVGQQVYWRRVHGANNSLRNRESIGEFAHALKASLDRRRAAAR